MYFFLHFTPRSRYVVKFLLYFKLYHYNSFFFKESSDANHELKVAELKRMDSQSFSKYLSKRKEKSTFDILYLFSSSDLKKSSTLLEYYHSKVEAQVSVRMRFATAFYMQNINSSPNYFEISQFNNYKQFKPKYIYNINEIKASILNLDWNEKSHKLVLILNKKGIVDLNFLLQDENSVKTLSNENGINEQIKYKNIHFKKVELNKNQVDQSIVDQIFKERFLSLQAEDLCQEDYLRELYFLKRNSFSSSAEYKISREDKVLPVKYAKLKSQRINAECEIFKKETEFSYPKCENRKWIDLTFKKDILKTARNLFLTCAKYNNDKIIWVEIFNNESSLNRILDIHLTAEYLVEQFKMLKSSRLKIKMAKINRFLFDQLDISKLLTFLCVGEDLSKAEILNPSESVYEAMQCFTHFTYEETNRNLLVLDLRTLHLRNEFLITEPIVFSLTPGRFSSSDLGSRGIEDFKSQHKCNEFCKEIGLKAL